MLSSSFGTCSFFPRSAHPPPQSVGGGWARGWVGTQLGTRATLDRGIFHTVEWCSAVKPGAMGEGGEGVIAELCMTSRWLLPRDWLGIPSALKFAECFSHCLFWDIFVFFDLSLKLSLSQPITLVSIFNCYSLSIGCVFLMLEYQWRCVCVFFTV